VALTVRDIMDADPVMVEALTRDRE